MKDVGTTDTIQRSVVYDVKEETAEKQKERIMKLKTEGDKRFTEGGRMAEIFS